MQKFFLIGGWTKDVGSMPVIKAQRNKFFISKNIFRRVYKRVSAIQKVKRTKSFFSRYLKTNKLQHKCIARKNVRFVFKKILTKVVKRKAQYFKSGSGLLSFFKRYKRSKHFLLMAKKRKNLVERLNKKTSYAKRLAELFFSTHEQKKYQFVGNSFFYYSKRYKKWFIKNKYVTRYKRLLLRSKRLWKHSYSLNAWSRVSVLTKIDNKKQKRKETASKLLLLRRRTLASGDRLWKLEYLKCYKLLKRVNIELSFLKKKYSGHKLALLRYYVKLKKKHNKKVSWLPSLKIVHRRLGFLFRLKSFLNKKYQKLRIKIFTMAEDDANTGFYMRKIISNANFFSLIKNTLKKDRDIIKKWKQIKIAHKKQQLQLIKMRSQVKKKHKFDTGQRYRLVSYIKPIEEFAKWKEEDNTRIQRERVEGKEKKLNYFHKKQKKIN